MAEEKLINKELVGRNIHYLREKLDYTVEGMSEECDVSLNSVYKWQRGETLPTVEKLYQLSKMFSISVDNILSVELSNVEDEEIIR